MIKICFKYKNYRNFLKYFRRSNLDIVRLGALNISKTDEESTEDVEIDRFVPHPEYDSKLQLNDIAIVHLEHDVKFTGKLIFERKKMMKTAFFYRFSIFIFILYSFDSASLFTSL